MAATGHDWDYAGDQPPAGLSEPVKALWWLARGNWQTGADWEKAHGICQLGEGTEACDWVHALAHMIEGDDANSQYWYRRAGQQRQSADARQEWAHILGKLG